MQHDPTAASLAASIAAAVACRDRGLLAAALTDTVRPRALLPGGLVESHGRDAVVAPVCRAGSTSIDTVELVESAGRRGWPTGCSIHYRLDLAQRGTHWACTQTLDLQDSSTAGWPPSTCCAPASARSA